MIPRSRGGPGAALIPKEGVMAKFYYGGQAVMEGVMMRAPHSYCVAVRRASGNTPNRRM